MCLFPSISQNANYNRLTEFIYYLFMLNPRKLPSGTVVPLCKI